MVQNGLRKTNVGRGYHNSTPGESGEFTFPFATESTVLFFRSLVKMNRKNVCFYLKTLHTTHQTHLAGQPRTPFTQDYIRGSVENVSSKTFARRDHELGPRPAVWKNCS